ncbi:tRNA (N6-threonylcarbamoyladenosine(37)-N6)-methyltransferase TrmO [Emergencia sp.]|uniref:tRNA (N6-threonylcarbamoyladenosine(37)-N6)-methyltransferase TrmO n=1 Tax=Emergencia sp. TaxID=1926557 RepID=UPI003AF06379
MTTDLKLRPIAHIRSVFPSKFGIPRQSGLTETLKSEIVFEEEFRSPEALRGLSDFSHLWIIWGFSENAESGWSPTVRPPRLGGNQRMGVFATRSPFRPNPLGLSSVKIEAIKKDPVLGPVISVCGADLMDGTPIYDLKPYIPADCHPEAVCGFADQTRGYSLAVTIPPLLLSKIPQALQDGLFSILSQDPRPSYQEDPDRIYGFGFAGFEIKFRVVGKDLEVVEII